MALLGQPRRNHHVGALEQLERVTKELPKIVQNERGEYVAAEKESVKKEENA